MEPKNLTAAHSRLHEAAESILQHAHMPQTHQKSFNGLQLSNSYPLEKNSPQQPHRISTLPISRYSDFSMSTQNPRSEMTQSHKPLPDDSFGSPREIKPAAVRRDQQPFRGQPSAQTPVMPNAELRQPSGREFHAHGDSVKQAEGSNHAESSSPVSSRGFVPKESEASKPSMRPLGKKSGKRGASVKQEDEIPPPWSELKTKAGKDRKRLPLACIACRRKKIRCSGEKPACKHCFRSRTPCVYKVTTRKAAPRTDYMAMLDKRLKRMEERVTKIIPGDEASSVLATGRAQLRPPGAGQGAKAHSTKKRPADEAFGPPQEDWVQSHLSKTPAPGREHDQSKTLQEGSDQLPPKEIQEHLAEIYFECLYGQSYLLLHKPSFMRRLRAGTAPPVLVLAVCAIAARFSTHPRVSSEPAFLRGEEWAAPAREIALKCYDQPSITILIVLLILGLHEFGTCRGGRSWMFCGMAMRMAYALQLHRELDHDPLGRKDDADPKLSATDREIRRRTMWACFMMDRFNSSGTERPTCASEEHIKIQLPNKEFNFHNEIPGPTETLEGEKPSSALKDGGKGSDPANNMGVASYTVRIIVLWGRVIRYLNLGGKEIDKYELWHPQSHFAELNKQVGNFKASLPAGLQYNPDNLATHAADKLANQFLLLHISYYQVVLFLHRYAIPTYPGAVVATEVPKDFLSASAQAAIEAADRISEIISHAVEHTLHAPFAGYCAFTSSTVHIWSRFSNQPRLQASAEQKLKINIEYIKRMEKPWGMFHFMADNLRDMWLRHKDHALRKSTATGGNARSTDGSLFQYGDWFKKYPHGVSDTDYDDPVSKVKEEGINEVAMSSQKSDLQSVDEFFHENSPPATKPNQANRRANKKPSKPTAIQTRQAHPPLVLPQDAPPPTPPSPRSMIPMAGQTPIAASSFSPHPSQPIYSTLPPQTYDILSLTPDMNLLPNLDRNIVYNAYAGTSGPGISSADASVPPMSMDDPTTGMWEQAMVDVNAQAQAMGGMGPYMQDFPQSSAWFMPFNMPPPTNFLGDGGADGYGGFAMGNNHNNRNEMGGMGGDGDLFANNLLPQLLSMLGPGDTVYRYENRGRIFDVKALRLEKRLVRRTKMLFRSKRKDHASPLVSSFGESSLAPEKNPDLRLGRVRWLLDAEILPGWGTWRVLLMATLWTIWLLFLAIKDTGDDYLHLTKRFGIIAASQLPLHYLLAFKSSYSPISYLTRLSHEELNPYHRALGRILLLFFSLHASFYLNFFLQKSLLLKRIKDTDVILGLSAIMSFLILGTTALAKIREKNYFLFFSLHVAISLSVLPILYFHVSHLRIYILEAAAIYTLLIIQRNISQSKIENAVLEPVKGTPNLISISLPLSNRMNKTTFHPGQHIYLSLPTPLTAPQEKLRLNPFTVANLPHQDNHIRLVLRTLNGTTDILSKLATNTTPSSLSSSSPSTTKAHETSLLLEGPYGAAATFPNLFHYDRILLVAGGVGATFTIPIYRDLVRRGIDTRKLRFVWSVKRMGDAAWGIDYLKGEGGRGGGGGGCEIYCTGDDRSRPRNRRVTRSPREGEVEAGEDSDGAIELQERVGLIQTEDDDNDEDGGGSEAELPSYHPLIIHQNTRPDFHLIVQETFAPHDPPTNPQETSSVSAPARTTKVAMLTCGPPGMSAALRREATPWVVERGKEVWWHSEEFGW
ncbi:MAG: hypothetical protein Q9216_004104 [Gyalolechia sp. 2 TL-2023]